MIKKIIKITIKFKLKLKKKILNNKYFSHIIIFNVILTVKHLLNHKQLEIISELAFKLINSQKLIKIVKQTALVLKSLMKMMQEMRYVFKHLLIIKNFAMNNVEHIRQ